MTGAAIVEVAAPSWLVDQAMERSIGDDALHRTEAACRESALKVSPSLHAEWSAFRATVAATWRAADHVVLRGLPPAGGGVSLLLAAMAIGTQFRTYRRGQIVKRFRMSPWTTALSHTVQEGHFHTDLNTDPTPPRATAIQCVTPDPGAPSHGLLRVARLVDVLARLRQEQAQGALRFLLSERVTMVSDTAPKSWSGTIVARDEVRFHPETLRAAERRAGRDGSRYDAVLSSVKSAALAVSSPIDLHPGDVLLVSNARALHYRGACTVRFRHYPSDYEAREVYVVHLMEEPQ